MRQGAGDVLHAAAVLSDDAGRMSERIDGFLANVRRA